MGWIWKHCKLISQAGSTSLYYDCAWLPSPPPFPPPFIASLKPASLFFFRLQKLFIIFYRFPPSNPLLASRPHHTCAIPPYFRLMAAIEGFSRSTSRLSSLLFFFWLALTTITTSSVQAFSWKFANAPRQCGNLTISITQGT